MKRSLFLFVTLFLFSELQSQPVTFKQAKERAIHFFKNIEIRESGLKSANLVTVDSFLTYTFGPASLLKSAEMADEPAFYIFNRTDEPGFVMVSAEEKIKSIIAWSDEATICEINPALKFLLDQYAQEIAVSRLLGVASPESVSSGQKAVAPLLGNIKWHQTPLPYNALCPVDTKTGRTCPAGCVATAMAQIIYYHRYPTRGTGSKTYSDRNYSFSVNFAGATYDYDAMSDQPAYNVANDEIAELLFHCGVSVETDYGPYGSSAFEGNVAIALNKYFKYKLPAVRYYATYSPAGWKQMIANELNSKRPILYGALDPYEGPEDVAAGHAFILDGQNDRDEYHLNFGWGGCSDGYYNLGLLNPTDCGDIYVFSDLHMMVTGIEPATTEECLLSVNENYLECPASGGLLTVNVTSNSSWTLSEEEDWLLVTPLSGTGNRSLTITASSNDGYEERNGAITLKSCSDTITIHVVQKGSCSLSLSTDSLRFSISGGRKKIGITTTSSWLILSDVDWIYATPAMGSGNDSLRVTVTNNTGFSQRTGIITLYGCNSSRKIRIYQDGTCSLELSKVLTEFSSLGGKDSVTVTSGTPWAVKSDVSWITFTPVTSEGTGIIRISAEANAGNDKRTGNITVSGCNADKVISVVQEGVCFMELASNKAEFGPEAEDRFILVSCNSPWVAVSETCWISVSPVNGQDTAYLGITVLPNLGQAARSGNVTVTGCGRIQKITVIQQSICPMEVSATKVDFAYMPGNKSVTVSTTSLWSVTSDTPWISLTPKSGSRTTNFLITVPENKTGVKRTGSVDVAGCYSIRTITVTQDACSFSVPDQDLVFSHEAGNKPLNILSTSFWTASANAKWLTVTPMYWGESGSTTLMADANPEKKREAVLTVSGCYASKEIRIIQEGNPTPVTAITSEKLKIYPSPTSRYVKIEFPEGLKNSRISICNLSGQEIIFRYQSGSIEEIDLDDYADGIYYIRVSHENLVKNEKILLKRNL